MSTQNDKNTQEKGRLHELKMNNVKMWAPSVLPTLTVHTQPSLVFSWLCFSHSLRWG